MIYNIFIFTALITFSAFFSASETAIFSLSKVALRQLQEKNRRAKVIKNLLRKPTHLLSAIVFGNLLFNIGISSLSTAIFVGAWGPRGLIAAVIFSWFIILFFGEIFPKIFAINSAKEFSLPAALVLNIVLKAFLPLIAGVERIVSYFSAKLIRGEKKNTAREREFKTALLLSRRGGHISEEEKEMISYILEFKDTTAGEILTARVDIKGINIALSQEEVLCLLRGQKHSKMPVYEDSLDKIKGIVYSKDIFLNPGKDWRLLIRKPIFIPESKKIDDILKLFWQEEASIAVVLDEYGGTEGIITLEDIAEEIFGEIYDEFESIEEPIEKVGKFSWRVYSKTPIKTVNIELDLNISEEEDTISGFLLDKAERIPKSGENFEFIFSQASGPRKRKVKFTIERATARRIVSVIVEILDSEIVER